MSCVERAIIMAAGKGERMHPITLHTPKPLVMVNGKKMIESVIDALHYNGIREIYVVVGYLKDKFLYLPQKYEGIKLIENPYYETCNNISSLYVARNYIANAIILDGDQMIYNPEVLFKDFEHSGYNSVWVQNPTKEWLLYVEEDKIVKCRREGGEYGWQLYSISRWTKKDAECLKKHLEEEFEINKNTQIYWDDIALFCYPKQYELCVYPMKKSDVCEIDTMEELQLIDNTYC